MNPMSRITTGDIGFWFRIRAYPVRRTVTDSNSSSSTITSDPNTNVSYLVLRSREEWNALMRLEAVVTLSRAAIEATDPSASYSELNALPGDARIRYTFRADNGDSIDVHEMCEVDGNASVHYVCLSINNGREEYDVVKRGREIVTAAHGHVFFRNQKHSKFLAFDFLHEKDAPKETKKEGGDTKEEEMEGVPMPNKRVKRDGAEVQE